MSKNNETTSQEKKKRLSIISGTEIYDKQRQDNAKSINYRFMLDSKAPRENVRDFKYWGLLVQEEEQWVISIGNSDGLVFGGGLGRVLEGFRTEYIKDMPEAVILMRKDYVNSFKEACQPFFDILEHHFDGPLYSS